MRKKQRGYSLWVIRNYDGGADGWYILLCSPGGPAMSSPLYVTKSGAVRAAKRMAKAFNLNAPAVSEAGYLYTRKPGKPQ